MQGKKCPSGQAERRLPGHQVPPAALARAPWRQEGAQQPGVNSQRRFSFICPSPCALLLEASPGRVTNCLPFTLGPLD